MKTSKEFFERLRSDEEFAKEVVVKAQEKIDAKKTDYKEVWIPIAEEYGYELTGEQLDELNEQATASLSEEELGKVSGGFTPLLCFTGAIIVTGTVTAVTVKETME